MYETKNIFGIGQFKVIVVTGFFAPQMKSVQLVIAGIWVLLQKLYFNKRFTFAKNGELGTEVFFQSVVLHYG